MTLTRSSVVSGPSRFDVAPPEQRAHGAANRLLVTHPAPRDHAMSGGPSSRSAQAPLVASSGRAYRSP
jgi:hypothetical protein